MHPISTGAFLEVATAVGIGYDPRYPRAQSLIFLPPKDLSRFWVRPEQTSQWPRFVATILDAIRANDVVLVKPQRGTWPNSARAHNQLERCQAILSEALGVPNGWEGAIEFGVVDRELLIAILVTQFLEPMNDLLVLPVEGRSFIKFSHHAVVHVSCATQEEIDFVIAFMSAAKFELPDELPDPTFKRPAWARRTGGDV